MKTVHGILFEIYLKFLVWFWESQILLNIIERIMLLGGLSLHLNHLIA